MQLCAYQSNWQELAWLCLFAMRLCMISEYIFGRLSSGDIVMAYELTAENGLRATLLSYGATLQGLHFPDGFNCVLGFEDLQSYQDQTHHIGALIGPIANRTAHGQLSIYNQTYQMPQNDGPHNLHSGPNGFDRLNWKREPSTDPTILCLSCIYPDGHQGLPGPITAKLRFEITESGLSLDIRATPARSAYINMTYHPYFNLSDEPVINTHKLTLNSASYREKSAKGLCKDKWLDASGSDLDFTTPRPIGTARIDHFNHSTPDKLWPPNTLRPIAIVSTNDRSLTLYSNQQGVQVYTGDDLPYPRSAIALEPHAPPNSLRHGDNSLILEPGAAYTNTILYHLTETGG